MRPVKLYDFVVIGSGPAGQKAAIQAAKEGHKVAIVERENSVGGSCVHRGTIPSKTLRENALQVTHFKQMSDAFNVEMKDKVPLSTLMSKMQSVINSHDQYMQQQLQRNEIDFIHGRARFISDSELEVDHVDGSGSLLKARYIVIATGSRPRTPDDINVDHENIFDSDSILSMLYLPESITILGAGVIACEYASIFAILGSKVTIIDRYERPLGFLDSELTDEFIDTFEHFGGRFIGEQQIESALWDGVSEVVTTLSSGEVIRSEKMLFALGRVANVETLNIDKAGLELTERSVVPVNEYCQTKVENIYAVGDVVGPPSLASASMEQGRRAARHAMGMISPCSLNTIPMGIYTIPEMSTIGMSEADVVKKFGDAIVGRARFNEVARGQISGIQNGLLKLVADPTGRTLLGAQIVGEGATELIHIAQMGLLANCEIDTFVENIFNFPTLAEAYRVAALDIAGKRSTVVDDDGDDFGEKIVSDAG